MAGDAWVPAIHQVTEALADPSGGRAQGLGTGESMHLKNEPVN